MGRSLDRIADVKILWLADPARYEERCQGDLDVVHLDMYSRKNGVEQINTLAAMALDTQIGCVFRFNIFSFIIWENISNCMRLCRVASQNQHFLCGSIQPCSLALAVRRGHEDDVWRFSSSSSLK